MFRPERPQANPWPQVFVRHLDRVADMRAGRLHDEDGLSDRLEIGAEMHGRFERQDRHLRGLDPDMAELLLVDCLDAGRESELSAGEAALAAEVLLAGYRSAATGEVVALPLSRHAR